MLELDRDQVRKQLFYHVYAEKTNHFAKTGSGQTWGKHSKNTVSQSPRMERRVRQLKAPPFLNATPPLYTDGDVNAGKYDTVAGWTQAERCRPGGNPNDPRDWSKIPVGNGIACFTLFTYKS
jgi:hypothetical protein